MDNTTPETRMVAVDGTDALAYVIVRPGPDTGHVLFEAAAKGLPKKTAAEILRHVADRWEAEDQ